MSSMDAIRAQYLNERMTMATYRIPVSTEIPGNQASDSDVDRITAPAVPLPSGPDVKPAPQMSAIVELDTGGMFRIIGPELVIAIGDGSLIVFSNLETLAAFAPDKWCTYWLESHRDDSTE